MGLLYCSKHVLPDGRPNAGQAPLRGVLDFVSTLPSVGSKRVPHISLLRCGFRKSSVTRLYRLISHITQLAKIVDPTSIAKQ
jgi:hypothetical protein